MPDPVGMLFTCNRESRRCAVKTYIEVLPYPRPCAKWQKDTKMSKLLSVPSNNSQSIQVIDIDKN